MGDCSQRAEGFLEGGDGLSERFEGLEGKVCHYLEEDFEGKGRDGRGAASKD